MGTNEKTTGMGRLLNRAYDGLLPVSLFCGLTGMLLGPLPTVICVLIAGEGFYPLFAVTPFLIYLFTWLLKGGRDVRALIVTVLFSLAGAYLTALAAEAAASALSYSMSLLNIPILTILMLGKSGVLPVSAPALIYPLLFTAAGIAAVWELYVSDAKKQSGWQAFDTTNKREPGLD